MITSGFDIYIKDIKNVNEVCNRILELIREKYLFDNKFIHEGKNERALSVQISGENEQTKSLCVYLKLELHELAPSNMIRKNTIKMADIDNEELVTIINKEFGDKVVITEF